MLQTKKRRVPFVFELDEERPFGISGVADADDELLSGKPRAAAEGSAGRETLARMKPIEAACREAS